MQNVLIFVVLFIAFPAFAVAGYRRTYSYMLGCGGAVALTFLYTFAAGLMVDAFGPVLGLVAAVAVPLLVAWLAGRLD